MSLQTSEPLNQDEDQLPPARRRRSKRNLLPQGTNSRLEFFKELSHQATASLEFFILALVAAIVGGLALLTDAPAFYVLAVLLAPFLAPMVGLSLATLVGSISFFFQSIIGMLISSVFFFASGLLAGFFANGANPENYFLAHHLAYVSVADLLLLSFGVVASIVLLVRTPGRKPALVSAALAFELFLPAAVAGFGISSGIPQLFSSALITFLVHLAWATLLGALTLAILGLRPNNAVGYAMSGALVVISLITAIMINGSVQLPQMPHLESAMLPTVRPATAQMTTKEPTAVAALIEEQEPTLEEAGEATETLQVEKEVAETAVVATATKTPLIPTATTTLEPTVEMTLAPTPEPVLASIDAKEGNGAVFRSGPYLSAKTVEDSPSLLNGVYIKLYETVENEDGEWGHVRLVTDETVEGWILRSLIFIVGTSN